MKTILSLLLIINGGLNCFGFSVKKEDCLRNLFNTHSDTTIVSLDNHGDTLDVFIISDSILIEKRNYYSGNNLRMVRRYKDGYLFSVDKSYNTKGNPIYPGTFLMGNGSIINYTAKGKIESIEYWLNYELSYVEYFKIKRKVKRVFYHNNIPTHSIITRNDGRILSKTSYDSDGTTIIRTEYFDEKLNVVHTLYDH